MAPNVLYFTLTPRNVRDRLGTLYPSQLDAVARLLGQLESAADPRGASRFHRPTWTVTFRVTAAAAPALRRRVRAIAADAAPALQRLGVRIACGFRAKRPA